MAYGYECCQHKLKTYFVKMSELNDMFTQARVYGRTGRVISNLVKPSCLIIDEVGHCVFDKENTRMFFDLIDRRYNNEGPYTMIFTSNKQPSQWIHTAFKKGHWSVEKGTSGGQKRTILKLTDIVKETGFLA